ncbi:zinc-finger protein [Madurella fahalii]|uniref:Zinc-finger protein n=1 Tax=Madurella fahalii TaxID=1157608 RepID=A0ABQ0G0T8_9PEZI
MDGSFESSGRFPGNGDGFHRHSQSRSNHLDLGFQSMMPPQLGSGPATSSGDVPSSSAAYESHDDLCVDHCMGVGLYNGYQQFNHRGVQPTPQARWARENTVSRYDYSIGLAALPLQFRSHLAPPASNPYQQPWFGQHLDPGIPCSDDDCRSMGDMSCCDSQCTMTGKCTDVACADTDDACTDQNCPERPVPVASSEVVSGAAALISINHAPEDAHHDFNLQQPAMAGMSFDLSNNPQQSYLMSSNLLPSPVGNITNHLLVAHSDTNSSNCTRPCPLDDPQNYPYCHIPLYNHPSPFHQYNSVGSDLQMHQSFVECGAEIHDPESFLAHFNSQHRPHFTGGTPGFARTPGVEMHDRATVASAEAMSPPATPLDTSDSGASSGTPSPLTPLSNSVEMTDAKPEASPHLRSTSVVSSADGSVKLGTDEEHKCLWKEEGSPDVCGQVFPDAEELFRHASEIHIKHAQKGAQGFRCGWDDCPRSEAGAAGFPQRSKIERHMQTHIGHKPHICPTCNKGFSAKQALTQHMFIHSNEKPLVCNICHKAFRYPSALTMHQRVHSGVKPLKCPVCGKGFSESSNLSKHKRTHEVKGRFTCTVPGCDRNFHRQDQLRRHMKTHQKDSDSRRIGTSEASLEGIYDHLPQS